MVKKPNPFCVPRNGFLQKIYPWLRLVDQQSMPKLYLWQTRHRLQIPILCHLIYWLNCLLPLSNWTKHPLTLPLWWCSGKESTSQCRRHGFHSWVRKNPWRKELQHTLLLLPGKFHGHWNLAGYSPWGCKRAGHA